MLLIFLTYFMNKPWEVKPRAANKKIQKYFYSSQFFYCNQPFYTAKNVLLHRQF